MVQASNFQYRSQLKTWLLGILTHKVIDIIRLNRREVTIPDSDAGNDSDKLDKLAFQADGHVVEGPNDWCDPHKTVQQSQFFQMLECLNIHWLGKRAVSRDDAEMHLQGNRKAADFQRRSIDQAI
jgi:DNA-directed RNA polymerase specialized sigma24 family protein